jgi:hypothetical protein
VGGGYGFGSFGCVLLNGDGCCVCGIEDGGGIVVVLVFGFSYLLKMGICVRAQLYLVNAGMYSGSGSIVKL